MMIRMMIDNGSGGSNSGYDDSGEQSSDKCNLAFSLLIYRSSIFCILMF